MTFRTAILVAAAGLASLIGVGGQAQAQARAAEDDSAPARICVSVVGVRPGESHYGACVASLARSSSALDQARAQAAARADCLGRGLNPETPEGAQCVLAASQTPRPAPAATPLDAKIAAAGPYMRASPAEARLRQERACASLGFDPTTRGFTNCVTRLQSTLFMADNPLN